MRSNILFFILLIFTSTSVVSQSVGNSQTQIIAGSAVGDHSEKPSSPFHQGNGMMFTQNKGQLVDMNGNLCPDLLYKGDGGGSAIYLRKTGISYVQSNMGEVMHKIDKQIEELNAAGVLTEMDKQQKKDELMQKEKINIHRVDMDFEGANTNCRLINEDELDGYKNYYYAHCPNGVLNVKQFNKVTYKNIYKGIDIKYYGDKQKGVKYDLIVQPHADPDQIKLRWKGATEIEIKNEELIIKNSLGEITETLPKVYQNINGKIVDVKCKYKLDVRYENIDMRNDSKKNISHISHLKSKIYEVHFELGTYNLELPLVIDPSAWVTYYGGSLNETQGGIANDPLGNVLVTGVTNSLNFPVTTGATQTTLAGNIDVFILKLNPSGTPVWSTYYGGTGQDRGIDIASDAAGNVYVTGNTASSDFPTLLAFQSFFMGGGTMGCIFIIKLNSAGSPLWATYYGAAGTLPFTNILSKGITTDQSGNVIITGYAESTTFPVSAGAYQTINNGFADAFILKLNSAGGRVWATYYGGANQDEAYAIATDQADNIYITGRTQSTDFPVAGSFQPNHQGGTNDAFIVKVGPAGNQLWATYYGGTGYDGGNGITIDANGDVLITGQTGSANFPVTLTSYQPIFGGYFDAFIVKLNANGIRIWATFAGGNTFEIGYSIACDPNNNVYIYGEWEDVDSGNYPISPCAYQKDPGKPGVSGLGNLMEDQFIAKYDTAGTQLCITYMGGTGHDDIDYGGTNSLSVYGSSLYITGTTDGGYPVTPGAFQTIYGGGTDVTGDIFIASLCTNLCEAKVIALNFTAENTIVCTNNPVKFTPTLNNSCDTTSYKFQWFFPGGFPANSNVIKPVITYPTAGTYTVKLVLTTPCKKDSITNTSYITVNSCGCSMNVTTSISSNVSCGGSNNGSANATISNGSGGLYTYSWSNGVNSITNAPTFQISNLSLGTYTVTVTDGSCASISTIKITQALLVNAIAATNVTCNGGSNGSSTVNVSGGGGSFTYSWSNGTTVITNSVNNSISNLVSGTYTVTITQGSCTSSAVITVTQPTPVIVGFNSITYPCMSNSASVTTYPSNGNLPYTYLWSNGQTTATATGLNIGSTYTVNVTDVTGCSTNGVITISSPPPLTVTMQTQTITCTVAGSASVYISNGIGPFTYSWSTGHITSVAANLAAGNYTVTVTDGNGCTISSTVNVSGSSPGISATFTQSPGGTICTGTTVNFINTGTAPGAGVSHNWTLTGVSTSAIAVDYSYTFLNAGTYSITHVALFTNSSCRSAISGVVKVIDCNGLAVTTTANSVCTGICATVTANGTGGSSPYSYTWSNGSTAQNINPCPATTTTYTVTIKDTGGKTSTSTAVVTIHPAVTANSTVGSINCSGASTGSATATGSSGTSPYTFNWSTGATGISTGSMSVVSLPAGNYTVTVTDSKGCTATTTAILVSPPPLTGQIAKGTASCNNCGCKEWLLVNAIGGTPPYNFLWPNGYDKRYKNKVCTGSYTIKITDKNGCSVDVNITAP